MPHRPRIDDDDEGEVKALTREQAAMLLRMTPERHRLMIRLILASGLRIGEVVGLQWKHVRLDGSSPHVRVRRTYSKDELGPPKSKYGRREVPISEDLRDALRAHRKVSEWPGDDDLVFPSQTGTYLRADNLRSRMLKPIMQEIGAPWARFHSLRHTCASMLFEHGANVKRCSAGSATTAPPSRSTPTSAC